MTEFRGCYTGWMKIVGKLWVLALVYWVSRLATLLVFPIWNDEGIYLHWAQMMVSDGNYLWHSLTHDGKMPLLLWIWGGLIWLFGHPLVVGRVSSVFLGWLTVWGLYRWGRLLGGRKSGWFAGLVYVLWPLGLWFDKLVLMEAALGACVVWSGYLLMWSRWKNKPEGLMGVAWLAVVGIWIKLNMLWWAGVLGVYWLVWIWAKKKERIEPVIAMGVVALVMGLLSLVPLALAPGLMELVERSRDSVWTGSVGWLGLGWRRLVWLVGVGLGYGGWLMGLGWWGSVSERKKWVNQVVGMMVLSLVVVFVGSFMNVRYVFPFLVLGCVPAGHGLRVWWKKRWGRWVVGLGVAMSVFLVVWLGFWPREYLHSMEFMPGMRDESGQTKGWVSGYGVREAQGYVSEYASRRSVVVLVRPDSGNPESAMLALNFDRVNVVPMYVGEYVDFQVYKRLDWPVLFVSRREQMVGFLDYQLQQVARFDKEDGTGEFVGVWEVNVEEWIKDN